MPKHVVLCLYVPKRMDVVQMKLFVSNKGTVTGYGVNSCSYPTNADYCLRAFVGKPCGALEVHQLFVKQVHGMCTPWFWHAPPKFF